MTSRFLDAWWDAAKRQRAPELDAWRYPLTLAASVNLRGFDWRQTLASLLAALHASKKGAA